MPDCHNGRVVATAENDQVTTPLARIKRLLGALGTRRHWTVCVLGWVCAVVAGWTHGQVVPLLCGVLIGAMALVTAASDYVPPSSHGLPGVPDGVPTILSAGERVHLWTVAGGALLTVVLAWFDLPWFAFVAIVLVVGCVTWMRAAPYLLGRHHARRIRRALRRYAPTTMMGFAGRSGGPWQLRMWEPYILASGQPNVVINLHAKYLPMILDGADLSSPLIQLGSRGTAEIGDLLVPSIKASFYVQNARTNSRFMAFDRITHVWLNHGDSDKPANFNPRHALYDQLVVCGEAGIDRYAKNGIEIPREQFVVLGRPQSRGIAEPRGPIADLQTRTVLYAPTWQGLNEAVNFSSLERGPEIVQALLDRGATVIFRPHPLSYRWRRRRAVIEQIRTLLADDARATGRDHRYGDQVDHEWSVADCANRSDALVSDVSSVVSDFLASGKPYAMTSMRGPIEEFRRENSVAETAYVILGDLSNLDEALDDLLFRDPLAAAREERRRYILGDLTGEESADAFAAYVRTLVGAP